MGSAEICPGRGIDGEIWRVWVDGVRTVSGRGGGKWGGGNASAGRFGCGVWVWDGTPVRGTDPRGCAADGWKQPADDGRGFLDR